MLSWKTLDPRVKQTILAALKNSEIHLDIHPPYGAQNFQDFLEAFPFLSDAFQDEEIIQALANSKLPLTRLLLLTSEEFEALKRSNESTPIEERINIRLNQLLQPDNLTIDNLWQLLIDKKDHDFGKMGYNRSREIMDQPLGVEEKEEKLVTLPGEPGFLFCMERAFLCMLREVNNEPLSISLIEKIHSMATNYMRTKDSSSIGSKIWSEIGRMPASARGRGEATEEDLQEILSYGFADIFTYKKSRVVYLSDYKDNLSEFLQLINTRYAEGCARKKKNEPSARDLITSIIEEYNENIKRANCNDERLLAIARFSKQLDTIHPFFDANMRTIVVLMNKLLIENGFPCVSMENPNDMDFKSSKWMVENQIKPGMLSTPSKDVVDQLRGQSDNQDENVDVMITDRGLCTPLHWAARMGYAIVVIQLLAYTNDQGEKVNVTATDILNKTALEHAVNNRHQAVIDILQWHEMAEDMSGTTPLEKAITIAKTVMPPPPPAETPKRSLLSKLSFLSSPEPVFVDFFTDIQFRFSEITADNTEYVANCIAQHVEQQNKLPSASASASASASSVTASDTDITQKKMETLKGYILDVIFDPAIKAEQAAASADDAAAPPQGPGAGT